MSSINSKQKNKFVIINNSNSITILGISFLKWVFLGSIVGILTGSVPLYF